MDTKLKDKFKMKMNKNKSKRKVVSRWKQNSINIKIGGKNKGSKRIQILR